MSRAKVGSNVRKVQMFDPELKKNGAKRRSLLNFGWAPSSGTTSGEPADPAVSDSSDFRAATAHHRQDVFDHRSLAERIRAGMSSDEHGTPDTERWTTDPDDDKGPADMTGRGQTTSGDKPLIDPIILLTTAWRFRFFIVFTTILGAALGVMVALSTPHLYVAVSQFVLDPRELRLTDTDFLPQSYSSDSTLALVDSQVAIVDSAPVLQTVVADLNLADDPEFNGASSSGLGGAINLLRELLSGGRDVTNDPNFLAVQSLSRAVGASRGERTFIVYVSAETEDPVKSALIANTVVDVYIDKQRETQSSLFERTAASLNKQLDELRQDVETAERRVEQYRAENDLVNAGGSLIGDVQLVQLNQQLAQIRAQKVEVQVRAETARQLNVDALLSGTAPEILQSSTIGELRAEYAGAKRTFDALTTSLGPRHPQRIAAEQALATSRAEISNELRRIVEATQTELKRVIQSEQQLTSNLAVLKSQQVDTSADLVRLRELEREAAATTQIYQSFLKRARETSEQQNLNTSNIRVISEASPPLDPAGPSRKLIALGGLCLGFLAGLLFALLLGAYRSVKDSAGDLFQGEAAATRPMQAAHDLPRQPDDHRVEADGRRPQPDDTVPPDESDYTQDGAQVGEYPREPSDQDREAEDIRAEISQMRETVERLYRARRTAREGGRMASN
jgi:uncharacterized protein involved in exopolysaccharide biosynthesis